MLSAYLDPHQDPAQCTTCTVGQPYGEWCFAAMVAHSDATCDGTDSATVFFGLGFCNAVGVNEYASAAGSAAPEADYFCDVPEQSPTIPPLVWDTAAVGCAAPSPAAEGCGANKLCVPLPEPPFQARLCVAKSGDETCPGPTYTARSVFYTSALDGRSCTPCGYTKTPISCTGTAVMYADSACGSSVGTVTDFSGACMSLPGVGSTQMLGASFSGTPSCAPVGGQPTGAVTPVGPVTVCCAP